MIIQHEQSAVFQRLFLDAAHVVIPGGLVGVLGDDERPAVVGAPWIGRVPP
jgi:hypothetical protein